MKLARVKTMSDWNPTPAVRKESEISVAVLYPGNRLDKMLRPLETTDIDVAVEPGDAYDRDVVIADNADRALGKEVIRNVWTNSKLVYRLRGDLWRELELWDMHPVKTWAAKQVPKHVDGVLSVTQFLADKTERLAAVPAGQAGMWIEPEKYPDTEHTDTQLRAVTLTNANYRRKVWPILEWAPIVNEVLSDVGGEWRVFGDGGDSMALREGLHAYDHVHYGGYTDAPKDRLEWANLMLHPSDLDGQPNAVLEGFASQLPVLTTDFIAFEELKRIGAPLIQIGEYAELPHALEQLTDPDIRDGIGTNGQQYCEENHTPERIGRQYERFLTQVVSE